MQKYKGFSLIELLISFLLLATLLLGIDALQINSMRAASENYYFVVAQQQMSVIQERLSMLNHDEINTFISTWNVQNQNALPDGRGIVRRKPDRGVSIYWGKGDEQNCKTGSRSEGCLQVIFE